MNDFYSKVQKNFNLIDSALAELPADSLLYKSLFAIRTDYAVVDELNKRNGNFTFKYYISLLQNILFSVISYPFLKMETLNKANVNILGTWRFDDSLSKELNIKQLRIKRHISLSLKGFKNLTVCVSLIVRLYKVGSLDGVKLFRCIQKFILFYKNYQEADLGGIKVLITEDDVTAYNFGVLLNARERQIKIVKIEYVQIDYLQHNNVFADYYFYPTTYHKRIRLASKYNKDLKYLKGGYLNTNFLKYQNASNEIVAGKIVYFTGHSNLFVKGDLFYIDQILSKLPPGYHLIIKIHPYDKPSNYKKYRDDARTTLYTFDQICNDDLINSAQVCLSIFSALSLEAKYKCEHSYFINYEFDSSAFRKDYEELNGFFDTISSPEMLSKVLTGNYNPVSKKIFNENVNMTFPDTFRIFEGFIQDLVKVN